MHNNDANIKNNRKPRDITVNKTNERNCMPLPADNDLLATRELEFCTAKSLLSMVTVAVLAMNWQKNLSNCNSSTSSLWFTESTSHASLEPISSTTWKHLVDTQDMEWMNPDSQIESILSSIVASNTCCLKSLTGDILLPGHQVRPEWELINSLPLHANIINPDLRVRHTAAVMWLWAWLIFYLTVTSCRSYR